MASIKKNFLYNILMNVSAVIFPLITAPYIARVLEPDGIGLMNFANTYANYFVMFAVLGAVTYGTREIAKRRDDHESKQQIFSELLTILIINTVIVSLIFLITLVSFPRFNSNFLIFFVAGLSIFISPYYITSAYINGHEKFGISTSRNLIIRTLSIICMFLFVKTKSDLYIYMLLSVISTIGGIIWNLTFLKKDHIKLRLRFKNLRAHYKSMLILFSSSVAISIYTMLDSLMLGFLRDYSEVGYYNSSVHIARISLSIVTSLSAVAIPRVAYYFKNKDIAAINDLLSKSFCIVAFLAFPMAIGLICIAPLFVPLFLGQAFLPSILPLMIVSVIIIAIGFNNITGMQTMLGMGLDRPYLYCLLIGTILNFTLNLILIPKLGAIGASISSVFSEFMILAVMIWAVHKLTELRFHGIFGDIFKALGASVLFIPATFFMSKILTGWYCVIADIIICIILYAVTQALLKGNGYVLLTNWIKTIIHKKQKSNV